MSTRVSLGRRNTTTHPLFNMKPPGRTTRGLSFQGNYGGYDSRFGPGSLQYQPLLGINYDDGMATQYYAAMSLDGFIADVHDGLDWLLGLGMPKASTFPEFASRVGAIAMGSRTYLWLLREHVKPSGRDAQPWPYEMPTWVFSSQGFGAFAGVQGSDIRFVRGDVRPAHAEMVEHIRRSDASTKSNIWVCGGGNLAAQFLDAGLLDEIIVQVASMTLGGGAPLLPRDLRTAPLRMTSAQRLDDNFAELRYSVKR